MHTNGDNASGHDQLESEDYLRHLLRETPDNIYFKDAKGRFLLISNAMARYFNLTDPVEACGKTDFDFFSEEHAQQAHDDERSIMSTGRSVIGKEEKETWPDGRESWVSTSKEPLYDAQGRIIGTFGISRDITSRKEAEARAARYANQLEERNRQMLADLALAGELQAALLPTGYPTFPPGLDERNSALRFAHVYHPSQVVGGDFFLIIPISEMKVSVFICDGIGHGVRAALLAAILSSLFRERIRHVSDPADCLSQIDRELHTLLETHPDILFATAFCLTLDAESGVVQHASAGHLTPLVMRRSSGIIEPLTTDESLNGPALGLIHGAHFKTGTSNLEPGDRIILFTDGLIEVMNSDAEQFGEEGLASCLRHCVNRSPMELLNTALEAAKAFGCDGAFGDDVCALCVERA